MRERTQMLLERLRPAVRADADSQRVFESQLRLAQSEWLTPAEIERYQLVHLKNLVAFAGPQTVQELLQALPILTRATLRDNLTALRATNLPHGHWVAGERTSSGS